MLRKKKKEGALGLSNKKELVDKPEKTRRAADTEERARRVETAISPPLPPKRKKMSERKKSGDLGGEKDPLGVLH